MSSRSLSDWLSYIESQHPSNIELGLDRCSAVLKRMLIKRPSAKIITVAGTNGKGSTCALLTEYLRAEGYQVGTFTSPHFLRFNERIAIDSQPVTDDVICKAFAEIEAIRGDISLTYFEFNTLAALAIFSQAELDYWVLEVGLGGRLDSVNMVDADIAVVTSVAIDHIDWLGDCIEGIAREKTGIARKGCLLISGVNPPPQSIELTANEIGAHLQQKGRDFHFSVADGHWSWQGNNQEFTDLPMPKLPLENAATVIAVLSYAGIVLSQAKLVTLFNTTTLTGRFQTVAQDPQVIIDVAHNPEAATELATRLRVLDKKPIAVCGMLKDKDIQAVLSSLKDSFASWYLADLQVVRGAQSADLLPYVEGAHCFSRVSEAFLAAKAVALAEGRSVIVFGSFHTVADFLDMHQNGVD